MQVKAAVTLGYQQPFVIKDVEVAPPGKDEILVKIVATGVCHTDAVMRDNPGVVPMPAILGHEGAGIVASVGECGEVIVSACVDHCREKHAKPYGTRIWAGQAVSARLVGK